MTEEQTQHESSRSWSHSWQLPVFAVSLLLLGMGWLLALPEGEPFDVNDELAQAHEAAVAGQFAQATERLDLVGQHAAELTKPQEGQYHVLRGDVAYLSVQHAQDQTRLRQAPTVVDHYAKAVEAGQQLPAERLVRFVTSLIDMGRLDEALVRMQAFSPEDAPARHSLMRRVLTGLLVDPARRADAGPLLAQFLSDKSLSRENQIWAVSRTAEGLLAEGKVDSAANMLLFWSARLQLEGREGLAPLTLLLGQVYMDKGEMIQAEQRFMQVAEQLEADDPLNGAALVGLGRIRLAENNVVGALEHFDEAVSRYPTTRWHMQALVGKAECEARMGALAKSLEDYGEAVGLVRSAVGLHVRDDQALLAESMAGQREWRYAQGDYQFALELLELEEGLHGSKAPASLLLRLATTHEQIARQALGLDDQAAEGAAKLEPSPEQRGKASVHYERAASYFLAHANAVSVSDNDAYGESLWRAGVDYDEAGLHSQAIETLARFLVDRPDEDPHRLQVIYRLGRAYQADGQTGIAAEKFDLLVTEHPKSPEAYDSLVPLAQCYLAKGVDYWPKAEHLLSTVVEDNEKLRPESAQYRDALIELGRLYYRRGDEGDYDRAIARMDEAVKRYGDQPGVSELLFQLGDAYRKSVGQIDIELTKAPPPSRKVELQAERARRLDEARKCFDNVVQTLDAADQAQLSDLSKLYLRNAYFYRADCSYDLRQFEGPNGAISLYEKAVHRYEKDPAVLVAWIQIVNCWCELGKFDQARSANNQAKWFLKRIPDQAFADPNLPMSREHWQRWLDWTSQLDLKDKTAAAQP